jgi:hypothetical protein
MHRLWQSVFMVRGKKTPASAPEAAAPQEPLAAELESLRIEVRVLRQAIDEVREELQYLNNNGVRLRDVDQLPPIGILKRMAADVTSSDWSQRLQIDHGKGIATDPKRPEPEHPNESQSEQSPSPVSTPTPSSEEGSAGTSVVRETKPRKPGQLF